MPRFSRIHPRRDDEPATVFDQVNAIVDRLGGEDLVRLDMGDTCLLPPAVGRPSGLDEERWRDFNLYSPPAGIPDLRGMLVEKLRRRNGFHWIEQEEVQLTCGAIQALFASFKTLLEPGEEVLVLGPRWPLISGVIRQAGGLPVDAPFYVPLRLQQGSSVRELMEAGLSDRTAVIYLNTPNNPTGFVLGKEILEEVACFASRHDLWIVSDEAYEDFLYDGEEHLSIAALPGMAERVLSVFTFSKCLAAAGYRVGYVAARHDLATEINRVTAQTVYNAPTDNQQLVAQAMLRWDEWSPALKERYREFRDTFVDDFRGDCIPPAAGFYAFVDLRDKLGVDENTPPGKVGRATLELLEELIREGVALLPGEAFGAGFEGWLRACYIAEPLERLRLGLERLNRVLGR